MAPTRNVLPYRTDEADLHRLVAARARGRTLDQVRTLGFSAKSFDGVVTTAQCLSLVSDKNGELTQYGRTYALCSAADRPEKLAHLIRSYLPFSLALDAALLHGGPQPTPLEWLETWWAAHGFGSSESNRAEAAPVFAKLVEFAGLGRYIQGRKGHPSRIEWAADAAPSPATSVGAPAAEELEGVEPSRIQASAPPGEMPLRDQRLAAPVLHDSGAEAGHEAGPTALRWTLGPGREVVLHLPAALSRAERERVLRLVELLLME
jgi:hypothetical protein